MTSTIWKFKLDIQSGTFRYHTVSMPAGAVVLSAAAQNGDICIWALVDRDAERNDRKFTVHGTGWVLPDEPGKFIGTVLLDDGALVFHVFEAA